jgi:hypothetical protein
MEEHDNVRDDQDMVLGTEGVVLDVVVEEEFS